MATVVDLSALGALGFTIEGGFVYDNAGISVSNAGDVNGDGFGDIIVGASGGDRGGPGAGEAYVIFGKPGGFGTIDLGNLDPTDGFAIRGADYDYAGFTVAGAGDINGDGFDDLMIGTVGGSFYYGGNPRTYIIFGQAESPGTLDLDDVLPSSVGFTIDGEFTYGYSSHSIGSAGDINGDGFDDLIIGAPYSDDYAGTAYVIFGKSSGFGSIDLANLDPDDGLAILGSAPGEAVGRSVSGAGDVNGDGIDDLIVGASSADGSGQNTGRAYVIFGRETGLGTIDLAALAPADGFVIEGGAAEDQAGYSVSSAGDFNGDGFADIIIGAHSADGGGSNAGEAYVIFGQAGGFGTIDLANLAPPDGFEIRGDADDDLAGLSVSDAGDVNGDGFDDVIVGAINGDDGGIDAGEAYVIFGKASGFGTIDLSNLDPSDGLIVQGEAAGDTAGRSVSGAGDLNGDGFAEIIVGAPGNDDAGELAGAAYVLFGIVPTAAVTRIGSVAGQTIRGGSGDDFLDGREGDDNLFGAGGNDRLIGREGVDQMFGGAGNDIFVVTDRNDFAREFASEGFDGVFSSVSLSLRANIERLTLIGTEDLIGNGNGLANIIVGNSGSNRLFGLGGDDRLYGLEGDDRLEGGAGIDLMHGGVGDDLYIVTDSTDFANELAGEGFDRVQSSITLALRANVERLDLVGAADINGYGTGSANLLVGNAGANVLKGGDGNDRLFGQAGADVVNGGDGDDWLEGGTGRDRFFGGSGSDRFVFRDGDFSGVGSAADRIQDFGDAEGDRIRLDLVDANVLTGGDQDFAFLGTGAFTGTAGELRYEQISGNTYVQGDTNGDAVADFWIRVDGLHILAGDDFLF